MLSIISLNFFSVLSYTPPFHLLPSVSWDFHGFYDCPSQTPCSDPRASAHPTSSSPVPAHLSWLPQGCPNLCWEQTSSTWTALHCPSVLPCPPLRSDVIIFIFIFYYLTYPLKRTPSLSHCCHHCKMPSRIACTPFNAVKHCAEKILKGRKKKKSMPVIHIL